MKREPERPPEGAPEWMVSYADMITIMMAFFVVMYALGGRKDESAVRPVISSLKQQFGPDWPFANLVPGPYRPRTNRPDRFQVHGRMEETIGPRPGGGDYPSRTPTRISRPGDGLLRGGDIAFDEDRAALNDQQKLQLQNIATDIAGKPQKIEVRGHASRRPLPAGSIYRDAWDLAYARAREVADYLIEQGIDPHRIRIGVAGTNEPVVGPDAESTSRRNSRVEIHMLNEFMPAPAS